MRDKNDTNRIEMELVDCCIQYPADDSIPNFLEFLKSKEDIYKDWTFFYDQLRKTDKSLTDDKVAGALGVSLSTVVRFRKAIPARREHVIMLAALFGKSLEETSYMLKKHAHYSDFYPKSLEDNIWMYIIYQGRCTSPYKTFEKIRKELVNVLDEDKSEGKQTPGVKSTYLDAYLKTSLSSFDKFVEFVKNNKSEYGLAYTRLSRIILKRIQKADNGRIKDASEHAYANSYFRNQAFLNRHYREFDKMKKGNPPTREYIILLGLHLGYLVEGIDDLLSKANYSKLSVKDSQEACIYFALSDIDIKAPAYSGVEGGLAANDKELAQAMKMQEKIICDIIAQNGLAKVVKEYLLIVRSNENVPQIIRDSIKDRVIELM